MSFQAMAWAIGQPISNSSAKFLLVMIANYTDEKGRSWPSIPRLATDTGMSTNTVRRALAWLEQHGFIRREHRDGKQDILHLEDPSHFGRGRPTPPILTGVPSHHGRGTPPTMGPEPITNLSRTSQRGPPPKKPSVQEVARALADWVHEDDAKPSNVYPLLPAVRG
jgi:DNA-binding transcriptional MocR family regulator